MIIRFYYKLHVEVILCVVSLQSLMRVNSDIKLQSTDTIISPSRLFDCFDIFSGGM